VRESDLLAANVPPGARSGDANIAISDYLETIVSNEVTTPRRRRRDREAGDPLMAVTTSFPAPVRPLAGPRHDAIARRAYELYERRGRADGHDWEDWFNAERELWERAVESQYAIA
jgi:hypothetical protein